MKRLLLPENKISRLFINILFIVIWLPLGFYLHIWLGDLFADLNNSLYWKIYLKISVYLFFSALFAPIVFGTRYIWFKKQEIKFLMVFLINLILKLRTQNIHNSI